MIILIEKGYYAATSDGLEDCIINKIAQIFPTELFNIVEKLKKNKDFFLSEQEVVLLKMLTELHITRLVAEAKQSPLFNENVKDDRRITHVLHREKLYLFPFFRNIMILNSFWEAMDKTLKGECLFEVRFD